MKESKKECTEKQAVIKSTFGHMELKSKNREYKNERDTCAMHAYELAQEEKQLNSDLAFY